MPRSLEDWLDRLAHSRHTMWLLFFASFAETIIVPIPIELMLVPYMALNRDRIWQAASVVLAGCLAASLVGYLFGYLFFETLGQWAITTFGWEAGYAEFATMFERWGFFAIIAVGIIPIPFQIGMLSAGAAGYPVILFLLAAFVARGVRYYGLALLVLAFGENLRDAWRNNRRAFLIRTAVVVAVLLAIYWGFSWFSGR